MPATRSAWTVRERNNSRRISIERNTFDVSVDRSRRSSRPWFPSLLVRTSLAIVRNVPTSRRRAARAKRVLRSLPSVRSPRRFVASESYLRIGFPRDSRAVRSNPREGRFPWAFSTIRSRTAISWAAGASTSPAATCTVSVSACRSARTGDCSVRPSRISSCPFSGTRTSLD